MSLLPTCVQEFVDRQVVRPLAEIRPEMSAEHPSPYGSYWYRAVAAILLSGRVSAKGDGAPNMTEVNRLGKEANFNQYLIERVGKFFVAAQVLTADWRQGSYAAGPNFRAFWKHQPRKLQEIARQGVLNLIDESTGYRPQRATKLAEAHLIEFLILFFTCFQGQALPEEQVGSLMHALAPLPTPDLVHVARHAGLKKSAVQPAAWEFWLEEKQQRALKQALYTAEWAFYDYDATHKRAWFLPSPIGLGMLGLGPVPPAPPLVEEFKATSNLAIYAGAGLDFDKLVALFRYCQIKRIDQVFEFHVDRHRLEETPADQSPGEALRQVLAELESLPSALATLLQTKSRLGGKIEVRWCSALVKPETPEMLTAIREHPQLKGYLEPGAPAGYLLIKVQSRPDNFVRRCQALGFTVKLL